MDHSKVICKNKDFKMSAMSVYDEEIDLRRSGKNRKKIIFNLIERDGEVILPTGDVFDKAWWEIYHIDHVIAFAWLRRAGWPANIADHLDNLQLLPAGLNNFKGVRPLRLSTLIMERTPWREDLAKMAARNEKRAILNAKNFSPSFEWDDWRLYSKRPNVYYDDFISDLLCVPNKQNGSHKPNIATGDQQ